MHVVIDSSIDILIHLYKTVYECMATLPSYPSTTPLLDHAYADPGYFRYDGMEDRLIV